VKPRVPSIDQSPTLKLLPLVLSLIAGSCDMISFTGLGGLFTCHITGNLVVLAARVVAGDQAPVSHLLSVPVFVATVGGTKLLAGGLARARIASLQPLLLLQLVLLCGFLLACVAGGPHLDPNGGAAVLGGMLGVSAMAVQNALVQISFNGAPSTAVMTTNVTRFVVDVGEILSRRSRDEAAEAAARASHTAPAIAGFAAGCALAAGSEIVAGVWSLALPVGLALVALALSARGWNARDRSPRRRGR
jgi:uncharacterized membrane protein YoaK (UPF0700 family)